MRTLPPMNTYQQLLYSALALAEEADLVAILRAARYHRDRNRCIDLVTAELDKGVSLWDSFAAPSALHELFTNDWPEFRVHINEEQRIISLDFGTNGPASNIMCWEARMGGTGVVEFLKEPYRYWPEGAPDQPGPAPKGWNPLSGMGPN